MIDKRLVDAAMARETEYQVFDGEIPSLALRVNPSGRKVYALYYRTAAATPRPSAAEPAWPDLAELYSGGGWQLGGLGA